MTTVLTGMMIALSLSACGSGAKQTAGGETVSCSLFSVTMPADCAGLYVTNTSDNTISVFDKEAHEGKFGGFVFDVSLYKEPSDYAGGIDRKVGEFTGSDKTVYDVVMSYPTEVSYDYEKYPDAAPESYKKLSDAAATIVKSITGKDGGTFAWGGGTKGADLYGDVIARHVQAIKEGWDANRLEEESMSPMYFNMSQDGGGDVLGRVGYAYMDTNNDGIDELLIGEIAEGDWKGTVYDIYTMVDRKPAHVVSGWDRSRYYALEHGFICNEYSGGADLSGWDISDIEPNTTNLMPQVSLKVDGYENESQPWFISYGSGDDDWENVTEEEFNSRLETFQNYVRFDFTPLS